MRTLLSQFCEEFEGVVRPLLDPLSRSAEVLGSSDPDLPGPALRAQLSDLGHQVHVLADKVAEQQAYVLIFGPLKSGKSTLMNGLSGAYVSEVTSLPAYPCLVYVSHADKREFKVTDYGTETQYFSDPTALRQFIGRAHTDLADRIREAEEEGKAFDPSIDFTEAIRRVDVKVPAKDLAESGAVLVDTPGLYSRMKFGYDRMTRDFRNVAACAIFVVKSDNLFLEQVFQEFTELLELFNRIFLVVNIDTTKRDLGPDGKLIPSLEQEDPLRIIEAFENLAMSATLKAAAEEGRLRIYPVDLLGAASRRLIANQDGVLPSSALDTSDEFHGRSNFETFQGDLTDYLNSTDYLVSFLGDSLRRATSLMAETRQACRHDSVRALKRKSEGLERDLTELGRRHDAAERLADHDWPRALSELEAQLGQEFEAQATDVAAKTARALDGALEGWFQSDASLEDLVHADLTPLFKSYQKELSMLVWSSTEDRVRMGRAGLDLSGELASYAAAAQVDLSALGREALDGVDRSAIASRPTQPINAEAIPVRKRLWDWLLFRRTAQVRRRVFGPPARPSVRISPEVKQARLGQAGKEAIRRELDGFKGKFFAETVERMATRVLGDYARLAGERIETEVIEVKDTLAGEYAALDTRLGGQRLVLERFADLSKRTEKAMAEIEDLSTRYVQTDPDLLVQPMAGERKLPSVPAEGSVGPVDAEPAAPAETHGSADSSSATSETIGEEIG